MHMHRYLRYRVETSKKMAESSELELPPVSGLRKIPLESAILLDDNKFQNFAMNIGKKTKSDLRKWL